MKKGSFDLTGRAIDCRELPSMGDAGREIFRALKVACNGVSNAGVAEFKDIPKWGYLAVDGGKYADVTEKFIEYYTAFIIKPIEVLGQARIDAAKEGARLVFEGDVVPRRSKVIFYADGTKMHGYDTREYTLGPNHIVIAHKPPKENQPSIESRILAEKVGTKHDAGKPLYNLIPVHAEAELVDVLTFGATKYAPNQWRNVENAIERYTAAAMRHLAAYRMGETHDLESGKHHLAHAMCCLAFIVELDLEQNK